MATVRTIIMGLNDYGNEAVRRHVEGGNVETGVEKQRAAIHRYLTDATDPSPDAYERPDRHHN